MRTLVFLLVVETAVAGCGGSGAKSANGYEEYECPAPIGKIVREDCSRSALHYDGADFHASVGIQGVGASASYKEQAVRQADALVSMLKEQRVALCHDFNTCKVNVAEYRGDRARLDDSFVALLALKDRMAAMDAEQASRLLGEIQRIRSESSRRAASGYAENVSLQSSSPSGRAVAAAVWHRFSGKWRIVRRDEASLAFLASELRTAGWTAQRIDAVVKMHRDDPGRIQMVVDADRVTYLLEEKAAARMRQEIVRVDGDNAVLVREVGEDEITHRKADPRTYRVTLSNDDVAEVSGDPFGTFWLARVK